jgi:hypothetical protein
MLHRTISVRMRTILFQRDPVGVPATPSRGGIPTKAGVLIGGASYFLALGGRNLVRDWGK